MAAEYANWAGLGELAIFRVVFQRPAMKYHTVLTTCDSMMGDHKGFLQLGLWTKGRAGHPTSEAVL